jgi:adenine-specific DNA methylase
VDPLCPQSFRDRASKIVYDFASAAAHSKELGASCDHETWIKWQAMARNGTLDSHNEAHWNILRFALLDFIADFANWDNSTVKEYLDASRELTQAAHEALGGEAGTRPLVVDPFAGGGSIPLEALRVGADSFASDLNPVAVLLNKVLLEYIPRYGQRLAGEVRKWGTWIQQEAEKELASFYPPRWIVPNELRKRPLLLIDAKPSGIAYTTVTDAQEHIDKNGGQFTHCVPITTGQAHGPLAMNAMFAGAIRPKKDTDQPLKELGAEPFNLIKETPIAYLWARTIQCEGPGCGVEVPLIRTLLVAKRPVGSVALLLDPVASAKRIDFRIGIKRPEGWVDQANPLVKIGAPKLDGTVKRGSVTCPCCGYTTPVARVREQLKQRRGGTNDARLLCVVTTRADVQSRSYRLPAYDDLNALRRAASKLEENTKAHIGRLTLVPTEKICLNEIRRISLPLYGMETWGDAFTFRQSLVLSTVAGLVSELSGRSTLDDTDIPPIVVGTLLALAADRLADSLSSSVTWTPGGEFQGHTFARQALAFVSDFAEVNPWCDSSGNWMGAVEWVSKVCSSTGNLQSTGQVERTSATNHALPSDSADAFVTDPPYYDAVPYAHLSDYFYVWLRRSIGRHYPELFTDPQVSKEQEIVVDRPHELSNSTHDIEFYERELRNAFVEGCRVVRPRGIATIVFASKTTASWEAMLNAVTDAGWIITGSWPIDTEREARIAAQGQARLASSVHLVCRPRKGGEGENEGDIVGDWREVLLELPRRIHEWMPRLASEGVVGADAIFACLGPALEIFSRYSHVEKANGEPVALKEYLEHVWAAVAKEALAQVFKGADATGFEPDARLTAMWLWTLNAPSAIGNAEEGEEEDGDEDEAADTKKPKLAGFRLEYDAARKIAQGLGAALETLTHLVEVKGDEARLLPVAERTRHLFGKEQEEAARPIRKKASAQLNMFAELTESEDTETAWQEKTVTRMGDTALDRVHQAMILFAAGRGEALKRFVVDDGVGRDGKFWRLAQALSALYPTGTDERRWVEGLMARKKQFGF